MTEVSPLRQAAIHASALESILTDVLSILEAINAGEMLSVLPSDEGDATRHNSATCLLDLAERRLKEIDAIPGTDLSIKLHVMADEEHKRLKAAA